MSYFFPDNCSITPDMLARAQAAAISIGQLNNSIRGGAGNEVGCLGEEAFLFLFPGSVSNNTYHHDITYQGMTIECKTKERTVPPQLRYDASVANYNSTQQADCYAFMSIIKNQYTDNYVRAYFCGFILTEEYKSKARFLEKGTIDPDNGWVVQADCWNVAYRELDR